MRFRCEGHLGEIWPGAEGRLVEDSRRRGEVPGKFPRKGLNWLCHLDITK